MMRVVASATVCVLMGVSVPPSPELPDGVEPLLPLIVGVEICRRWAKPYDPADKVRPLTEKLPASYLDEGPKH